MLKLRKVRIHGVEQPEVRDICRPKIRQAKILLPPHPRQNAALGRKNLHQPPRDCAQIIAGCEVEQRRHELRIKLQNPGIAPAHPGDTHRRTFLARITPGQEPEVFTRHLNGLFRQSGVLIPNRDHIGKVPRIRLLLGNRNIQAAVSVIGYAQEHIHRILIRTERLCQRDRRRQGFRTGKIEQEPVGEYSRRFRQAELAGCKRFLFDPQVQKAPGIRGQGFQPALKRALNEAVLSLQMLRAQQGTLHPNYRLKLTH